MKLLCWNARGLGNPQAIKRLQHTLKFYKPQMILMETKLDHNRMETSGSRGGLSLVWKGNYSIQVRSYSNNHIDVEVSEKDDPIKWRFTGFYGNLRQSNR
ncbi:expansin-A1-like [Gossypium australe]|uniref:Expansin-A1-like n=1 Tax=Gossypium australe TaxID=47621 RepID=A0A5B6WEE8_9ROSI|nr:expansin-A1-like [Gossypium australe]